MLIDALSVPSGQEYLSDICIVGAGVAGLVIADRLRDSGLSIILLESGGFEPELATQKLYRGENRGKRYFELDACRFRFFGGSTNWWGGWCRPFDAPDFERRDWMPLSGWPLNEQTLKRYYPDTDRVFGLGDSPFDLAAWRDRLPAPFDLEHTDFENALFRFSTVESFGDEYRSRLVAAPNITIMHHANLTGMELGPDSSRIDAVRVATLNARNFTVRPKVVILAAGGIENARLLLTSQTDRATGLGNEHDLVGRYFMEHLHVPAGHIATTRGSRGRAFYRQAWYDGVQIRGAIAPTAAARAHHQLPAASIAIEPESYAAAIPFKFWPPAATFAATRLNRKLSAGRAEPLVRAIKRNIERASTLPARFSTLKAARSARRRAELTSSPGPMYSLYFRTEQRPNASSRVLLSDDRDALGIPKIQLDWRIDPSDTSAITSWLALLDRDLRRRDVGRIIAPSEGWESRVIGGPHHMGTTRMAANPRHGVVDEHCQVHSVANLYVAGSSVFPTGGYANPTYTIVSLAMRIADTVRDRLLTEVRLGSKSKMKGAAR